MTHTRKTGNAATDFAVAVARVVESRLAQFLIILGFAVLIRAPLYGNWNYDLDDEYYWLIGQRLLHGATLYVDIWDRKPPALYLFYAAIGAISPSALAYQIAATACAALGGYGVNRLARLLTSAGPALLSGLAYCALLNQFGGENGQSPVLYNPLIIAGAWSIASRLEQLRAGRIGRAILLGTTACGIAVMFKQSAAIEAAFFGVTIAVLLWRNSRTRFRAIGAIASLALLIALPSLLAFGYYGLIGHLPEIWQALVTSNVDRDYGANRLRDLAVLFGRLALPLALAILGVVAARRQGGHRDVTIFVTAWALVALGAVAVFPAVFLHYALPILAPLCVLSAPYFARARIGPTAFGLLIASALVLGGTWHIAALAAAKRENDRLETYVREHTPSHRLFIWGVPSALYARIGSVPPSPILFAPHLYERSERTATGRHAEVEVQRILAWRPETVVVQDPPVIMEPNQTTIALVRAYLMHCRAHRDFMLADHLGPQGQRVYTDCAETLSAAAR